MTINSNIKEERQLFNKEVKEMFLNRYNEETQIHYSRYLSWAYDMETYFGKDLADFTYSQLVEFLKSTNVTTIQGMHTILSCISNYIDFATREGLSEQPVNWARTINGSDELEGFLNYQSKQHKYIDREELHELMDFCYNPQDAVIYGLLFEGVLGRSGLEELTGLKESDIDFKNNRLTLRYTEDVDIVGENGAVYEVKSVPKSRFITIEDSYIMETIKDAIDQDVYYKNNGDYEHLRTKSFELAHTGYVLRISGREELGKISEQNIYNRMKKMSKAYGNNFLNPKNVWVSGQIDYARKLLKEKGKEELDTDDYKEINQRFGYSEELWYSTKRRIKNYV